ncbi:MAG: hypothetical protein WD267_05435 [Balneolales bacterium]
MLTSPQQSIIRSLILLLGCRDHARIAVNHTANVVQDKNAELHSL